MAKEERDILYPQEETFQEEEVNVQETEEESLEDHLGYHTFYGY